MKARLFTLFIFVLLAGQICIAQSTQFTYQGNLTNGGTPANGSFDFEFLVFDSLSGGSQLGSTLTRNAVQLTNGIFAVQLDFGNQFPGANRFLEIHVRPAGSGTFTPLTPRQSVDRSPYAIQSLNANLAISATNATQLGGVAAAQYVLTSDTRMSDARNPLPNSANYIQNQTGATQAAGFNISGNGVLGGNLGIGLTVPNSPVDVVDSGSQIRFGNTVTDVGGYLFSGTSSQSIISGGAKWNGAAWIAKSTAASLLENRTGNMIFYTDSGLTSGTIFSPSEQMRINSSGNVGLGTASPSRHFHVVGAGDQEIGIQSSDTGGRLWTVQSSRGTSNGNFQIIDRTAGLSRFSIIDNGSVGIGTTAPAAKFHIVDNSSHILFGGFTGCSAGFVGIAFGTTSPSCTNYSLLGNGTQTILNVQTPALGDTGIDFRLGNTSVMSLQRSQISGVVDGVLFMGSTDLAMNGNIVDLGHLANLGQSLLCYYTPAPNPSAHFIDGCGSSIRLKKNIVSFTAGLDLVKRLRPVTFNWKSNDMLDVGLIAEDVEAVEPLLATHNEKGEPVGVKYEKIPEVLINAVVEQQAQIDALQKERDGLKAQLDAQAKAIDELKVLVCKSQPNADICQPPRP